jgi:ABC-type nitrate/sulfonate/bicarbonate transport system substrate-binding protein
MTTHVDTLWYTRCPIPGASALAAQLGWIDEEFARDSIHIASLRESPDRAVWESHFDHRQANSFRQGGNIPPIWTRSNGRDVRLIGLHWVDHVQAILVRSDSDISSILDLRGRRFGLPRRRKDQIDFWAALSLRTFLTALSLHGMSDKDVEIVELPFDEPYLDKLSVSHTGSLWASSQRYALQQPEALALARGDVDAIYSNAFRAFELQGLLGAKVIFDVGAHPDRSVRITNMNPTAFTASGRLCEERPDLVGRFLAQAIRAGEWAKSHRAETITMVARDVAAAEELVAPAFAPDFHEQLVPELSEEGIRMIESQKEFLLKHGFIEHDFDVRAWMDPRPLKLARGFLSG